mgnify:CR=1 FL=1
MHSQHNYYIEIDDMIIVKQKCIRLLNDIQTDKIAMEDSVKNNKKFVKKFMSRENIYKSVAKILNNKFSK